MVGRVKRSTLRTRVRERLLEAVLHSELRPGDRIIEGELALDLGVAKTTLREALQDLEHQGLVMKFENRGTYVTELKPQEIDDIYDLRFRLEPEAAARASHRLTPQQLLKLAAFVQSMRDAGSRQDFYGFFSSDVAFHHLIWEASGNMALQRALEAVAVPLFAFSGLRLVRVYSRTPSDLVKVCDDHWALLSVLKVGNPEEIRKVFAEKLKVFRQQNVEAAWTLEVEKQKVSLTQVKQEDHSC